MTVQRFKRKELLPGTLVTLDKKDWSTFVDTDIIGVLIERLGGQCVIQFTNGERRSMHIHRLRKIPAKETTRKCG